MIEVITYQSPQEQLKIQVLSDFIATLGDDKLFSSKDLYEAGIAFASGLPKLGAEPLAASESVAPTLDIEAPVATVTEEEAAALESEAVKSPESDNVVSIDRNAVGKTKNAKTRNTGRLLFRGAVAAGVVMTLQNIKLDLPNSTSTKTDQAAEAQSPATTMPTTLSGPSETVITVPASTIPTPTSTVEVTTVPETTTPATSTPDTAPTTTLVSVTETPVAVPAEAPATEVTTPAATEAPTTTVYDSRVELQAEKGQLVGSASVPALCEDSIAIFVQNEIFNPADQANWTSAQKAEYRRNLGDPRDILLPNNGKENCEDLSQYAAGERANNPDYHTRHEAGNDKYLPIMVLDMGAVAPGNDGNVVLGGHNTASSAPMRDLYKLQPGDMMSLVYNGQTHYYQAVTKAIVFSTGDIDQDNNNYTNTVRNYTYVRADGSQAKKTLVMTGCGTNGVLDEATGKITKTADTLLVGFQEIDPTTWLPL